MSSLTWLAHSEGERRRVLDVIRLLDEPGTVDDLGIGGIRDAFSDLLFPGTSVIQTRARYFLFVPWLYRDLERRAPIKDARALARWREIDLIEALMQSEDVDGVIGRRARAKLNTLPSAIYWQGLGTWGIRRLDITVRAYHRCLEMPAAQVALTHEHEENGEFSLWHPALPDPPDDFPKRAELALRREEADYLRDRIMTLHRGSLLAALVSGPDSFVDSQEPWAIAGTLPVTAPPEVRDHLYNAELFSLVIHGAQLLYNLMVAEAAGRTNETADFRERLNQWADRMEGQMAGVVAWSADRPGFWNIVRQGNPRLALPARQFADSWIELAAGSEPHRLADSPEARELIGRREATVKGQLARLRNRTALEAWLGSSGADRLLFRWPVVRTIIGDIVKPLTATSD